MASFVKSLFGMNGSGPRVPPPVMPVTDDGLESAKRKRWIMLSQRGRSTGNNRGGTLLTGAQGLTTPAPTRKSLLGE